MELTIRINMDDDALSNDLSELRHILATITSRIAMGEDSGTLRDYNGNTVGDYRLHE